MDSSQLDSMTNCISKINTSLLVKTLGNQANLVLPNKPIIIALDLINPSITNQILLKRQWKKNPCVISYKFLILFTHRLNLVRKKIRLFNFRFIEYKIIMFNNKSPKKYIRSGSQDIIAASKL